MPAHEALETFPARSAKENLGFGPHQLESPRIADGEHSRLGHFPKILCFLSF